MSNKRNAQRAAYNRYLEAKQAAEFEDLKRDMELRRKHAEEKRLRAIARKYVR